MTAFATWTKAVHRYRLLIMAETLDAFESAVFGQVLGTLISSVLLLFGYLMYLLWKDYIATLLLAFMLSQALQTARDRLVGTIRCLRDPAAPPVLRHLCHLAIRGRGGGGGGMLLLRVPPLILLAAVLALLLLHDYTHSWARIAATAATGFALLAAPLWLLDRRLLRYGWLISDESLVAALTLSTLIVVITFVGARSHARARARTHGHPGRYRPRAPRRRGCARRALDIRHRLAARRLVKVDARAPRRPLTRPGAPSRDFRARAGDPTAR